MMHVGEQVGKNLSISIENPDVLMISPDVLRVCPDVLNIPRCTEHVIQGEPIGVLAEQLSSLEISTEFSAVSLLKTLHFLRLVHTIRFFLWHCFSS